ncbi:MAG TPA: response regulator [Microvirga sp.]|nr:response regulator [Microvirga sp.]
MTSSVAYSLPATSEPVLVVDDQSLMADLVGRIVRTLGYSEVDEARDGLTALLMMSRKTYALVVCDLQMKPVSGLQLLKTVRADAQLKKTKFLIMTANKNGKDVVEAKAAGVDSFILKPFSPNALADKIKEIL